MQFEKPNTTWFKVTFWSPSWRSLNPWKGHLTIPKRAQRIARQTRTPYLDVLISCLFPSAFMQELWVPANCHEIYHELRPLQIKHPSQRTILQWLVGAQPSSCCSVGKWSSIAHLLITKHSPECIQFNESFLEIPKYLQTAFSHLWLWPLGQPKRCRRSGLLKKARRRAQFGGRFNTKPQQDSNQCHLW